eukprot:7282851-Prorocentrum_lima.AAC.1
MGTAQPTAKNPTYAQMVAKAPNAHKLKPKSNVNKTADEYVQEMFHREMAKLQATHHWMAKPKNNTHQKTNTETPEHEQNATKG